MPMIANINTDAQPAYEHDCAACVFVGQVMEGSHAIDCYICPADFHSVSRRHSSLPSNYGTFPLFIAKTIDAYRDVLKAAAYVIERFDPNCQGNPSLVDPEIRKKLLGPLIDEDGWSLAEYIAWQNRPEPGVIKGELMSAEEWKEDLGYTRASELGRYLDDCVEHEMRKEAL